jgi:hypothetical protein
VFGSRKWFWRLSVIAQFVPWLVQQRTLCTYRKKECNKLDLTGVEQ